MSNELDDMRAECNSIGAVKEKYKKGILDPYEYLLTNMQEIIQGEGSYEGKLERCRREYSGRSALICSDESMGSNLRWGIVSKKNLFGLQGVIFPEERETGEKPSKDNRLYLKGISRKISNAEI